MALRPGSREGARAFALVYRGTIGVRQLRSNSSIVRVRKRAKMWQHVRCLGRHLMADSTIHAYLSAHPFFKGLSSEYLELLSSHASIIQVGAQQRLFKQDPDANHFYIVRSGKVALEIPAVAGEPLRA